MLFRDTINGCFPMSVRHFQDCFTTVEWHAKCQVRSLSLYLPLQVREHIFRLCFAGNRVDNGGVSCICIFVRKEEN